VLADAPVWIDGQRQRAVKTNSQGNVTVVVPIGEHVISVDARGFVVERKITVTSSRAQGLTIDAAWERRVASITIAEDPTTGPGEVVDLGGQPLARSTGERPAAGVSISESFHPAGLPRPPKPAAAPRVEISGATFHAGGIAPDDAERLLVNVDGAAARATSRPSLETTAASARAPSRPIETRALVSTAVAQGRYERLGELGRGAMGVVFKAHDRVLERTVAMKVVGDEVRHNPAALEMFLQEAKAMAALNHPNLVTVYDQGVDGGDTFMVMEFIEGRTLANIIEQSGKLAPGPVLEIADQLAAGLAYAHGRRIVHRDIKPANIFVTVDGVVKIGDFGLARAVRQAQITHTKVCGTPLYMAPEQIRGSDVDFRTDLYSVGCTLYELLTGAPPFTEGEVMFHHMYTEPVPPSQREPAVPAEIDQVILDLLRKDKADRVASSEALRARIRPLRSRYA
jgi:predicted Ser/Thr protein kinase